MIIIGFPNPATDNEIWTNPTTNKMFKYVLSDNKWVEVTNLVGVGHEHDGLDSRKIHIENLDNVDIDSQVINEVLAYNGTNWANASISSVVLKPFFNYIFSKAGIVNQGWLDVMNGIPSNINTYLIPITSTLFKASITYDWQDLFETNHSYNIKIFKNDILVDTKNINDDLMYDLNISVNSGDKLSLFIEKTTIENKNNGMSPIVTLFLKGV